MDSNNRSVILLIAGALLLICVCVSIIGFAGVAFYSITGVSQRILPTSIVTQVIPVPNYPYPVPEVPTSKPSEADTPSDTDVTPETPPTSETGNLPTTLDIPPDVLTEMMEIEQQVLEIRGLSPNGEFERALFTPDHLRERVVNDFFEDYTPEDAENDALILAAFGLLEPGFDFHTFYVDLLSEQVAGFYDNETKEMVVVQGEAFAGPERLTYAHEYTHALQDQNYDIKNGLRYDDEPCEEDSERCAAIQALLEGDASVTEFEWFSQYSTSEDQQEIQAFYNSYESPIYDTAPAFMKEDFLFPYSQGYVFVNALFEAGGFAAIDAAYVNVPVSTEQILHPELYPHELPIPVTLPDLLPTLGEGWTLLDENVMGEWYTYLILARGADPDAQLDDTTAAQAAAGWGGDAYAVYLSPSGDGTALVMNTVWDSSAEASEFAETFEAYATARFGSPTGELTWEVNGVVTLFMLTGDQTIWVSAPDLATGQAILAVVQP